VRNLRDYAIVTASYWAFTVTDGALRMLVLLFLHERGFSPLELATAFILYEFAGMVTNFIGGWLGSRFGLGTTLFSGLGLQILACALLAIDPSLLSVVYVMTLQGLSGVAKDLTKMSSKSYVKLVVPEGDAHGLLHWVALITGSKNALKGVGFFVGGLLLSTVGFRQACLGMAALLALALVTSALLLPRGAGRIAGKAKFRSVFSDDARINWLAASRLFLFGSRDVWFAIALPVFLAANLGWSFWRVGGFLALWVIGYGFVQAAAPRFVASSRASGATPVTAARLIAWTLTLLAPLGAIVAALRMGAAPEESLVIGLAVFGMLFAVNSALHSYLIVAYADSEKIAMQVGFYYMANAAGRLAGTVLSGAVFQEAGLGASGLTACIVTSMGFVALSAAFCLPLGRAERRRVHSSSEVRAA
jgi:MFS family permease